MSVRWILASHNPGKLAEMRSLLADLPMELIDARSQGVTEPAETASTFVENALLKARHCARLTGLPSLADDSGLLVDALDDGPGLHTARYAGPQATTSSNIDKLLGALAGVPAERRGARFVAVVVWLAHAEDPLPVIAQGIWHGRILEQRDGAGGFGYDPVFFDPELGQSAARMDPAVKDRRSHRGQALAQLRLALSQRTAP
ncbi:MAG: RdgB/HAM1 family non-canonical purine NTP pyrophosphatase [Xanthomonadales bacterium]|nr:RdgB/HAM1 family non-canonical purine NTP pyrophosphatase [Xanthomonadales bacterium]MCB1633452.1 RdgB/HAM1 family non-canonical purine NTP pyrophosphatase [Xanthomonadales bacterium]